MAQSAFDLLNQVFQQNQDSGSHLWLLGESIGDSTLVNLTHHADTYLITNRWSAEIDRAPRCYFSDFNFAELPEDAELNFAYLPIPKERAQLHFLVNQSAKFLPVGGRLYIAGEKNQGIKNIVKVAKSLFSQATIEKQGNLYLVSLIKSEPYQEDTRELDDKNYHQLREIDKVEDLIIYSKPGVFGWDKLDVGSRLLMDYLSDSTLRHQEKLNLDNQTLLDLGCGYGYITLRAASMGFKQLYATDNNAAAINCMQHNARMNGLTVNCWPDDMGKHASQKFDLILCNPPFHQGFDHKKSLTQDFVAQMANLTREDGRVLAVVNRFIGLESLANRYFTSAAEVAGDKSFKIIELTKS